MQIRNTLQQKYKENLHYRPYREIQSILTLTLNSYRRSKAFPTHLQTTNSHCAEYSDAPSRKNKRSLPFKQGVCLSTEEPDIEQSVVSTIFNITKFRNQFKKIIKRYKKVDITGLRFNDGPDVKLSLVALCLMPVFGWVHHG